MCFLLLNLPKPHQNWIELVIRGPNLIECDKIVVKNAYYTVKCDENYEKWGGYICFSVVKPTVIFKNVNVYSLWVFDYSVSFSRLELHIHDQNAFVRSKSIQILTKLIEQRIVPIPRQHDLVEKVVGSIQDKSSNVRKNALVFITTYLGCNPYSDKLSLENLKEKLKDESEKLAKLKEELPAQFSESGWFYKFNTQYY